MRKRIKTARRSILESIKIKIICIGLVLGVVFTISSVYLAKEYMGNTEDQRLLSIKQAVQIARNTIEPTLEEYRDQNLSMEETLEQVRNIVRTMVYNDTTGENYIFMSAYDGIMLVQPFEPEKEMTNVWDLQDSYGVFIIRELVKAAKSKEGQGYVIYHYQRPGETAPQEKISFVMGIPDLGCYIGTGQYMSDIRESQSVYLIKIIGLIFILLILLSLFVWASMKEICTQNKMLAMAEQKLHAIFNNTFQFIGTLSPDGLLTKANQSSLKLIGKKEEDVIGRPFWETPWWTDEQSKSILKKGIHDCSKGVFSRFETTHSSEKNGEIYVDFNLSPIFDEAGNVTSLLAEGRDVTEQVKTRDDLAREKAFFNYVIESLPGIFSLFKKDNEQFLIKEWNQEQHQRLLGYSQDYMQDASMEMFVAGHDLPNLKKAVERLQQEGRISVQLDIQSKDNRIIPILYQASYFQHSGVEYIVAIGIELTEKIRFEKERDKLEAMLAQSQKMEAMGTLAGGIAHDFNNILSAILGYAELVQTELTPGTRVQERQAKLINATIRAKELVNHILLFSRQSDLDMKPIQPGMIIKEVLKLLRSSIPTTIEIRQNISNGTGTIYANATQLYQIIMNLCTNAYHAMRNSGGILTVSLTKLKIHKEDSIYSEISLHPGPYLLLEVSDTGYGMDRDTLSKIFDPYFTTKEKGEGTGLGLSVVHGIVKKYGGEIKVYSEAGQGSCFKIFFPEIDGEESQNNLDQLDLALQPGSERILLVDDDKIILDMTEQSLRTLGYQVTAYSSSLDALDAFSEKPDSFDLVITDMTMPILTGLDLSNKILSIRPQMPIILCTGYSELITKEKTDSIGIKSFLLKPVLREVLSRTIREVLMPDSSL